MSGRTGIRGGGLVGPMLAAAVLVVGLAVTLLTVGGLRAGERDSADRVMDQRTAVAQSAVATETGRYLDLLRTMAAGAGANDRFTAEDFKAAAATLAGAKLVGATSVVFAVSSPQAEVAQTQRYWRELGATGLVLKPQDRTGEHVFSIYSRPLNSDQANQPGVDISAAAEAATALTEARRTRSPTVSDTYVLLRDRRLPLERQQLSFLFAAPVYAPDAETGAGAFRGWIVMGLRGQDFLGGVLGEAGEGLLDGELRATNGDGQQVRVAAYTARGTMDLHRDATLPVANRSWTLVTAADSAYLPGAHSNLPNTVLIGGCALIVLLAGLVYVLASGRARAQAQVLVATAGLRTAEQEARRQAGLLGAIMASLADGVGVVDATGAFLMHNPAAKQLLGVVDDVDEPGGWQEHYGLFRPDGRTPFPLDELPLVRGLRGESSDGVELLVRNRTHPDGVLLSVDGRPLDPSAGQRGAVAVFHDITALRRHENDLSVFAGVVAHDLNAPLAIIRGHCESAVDVLAEQADDAYGDGLGAVEEARDALRRITRAVDRMAALIDTLLAYTTSRDAPLRLEEIPLGPLVADVVAERAAPRRANDAGPAPAVYVGPLPVVSIDPAMLRHVLDNLIGNALKYVQPGGIARIDVTAASGPDGWAQVEIADRGIGIPDSDKPDIFESFHRAKTASGYAGTGLGLAICRRIVERHGGTIGVTDNPGGGTRFHFTVPLAAPTGIPPAEVSPAQVSPAGALPAGTALAGMALAGALPAGVPPARDSPDLRPALPREGSAADGKTAARAALQRALVDRAAIERTAVEGTAIERAAIEQAVVGQTAVERAAAEEAAVGQGAAGQGVPETGVERPTPPAVVVRAAVPGPPPPTEPA